MIPNPLAWIEARLASIIGAGAGLLCLFLAFQLYTARAERDQLQAFADTACAAAGAPFAASTSIERDTKGKQARVKHKAGALCQRRIGDLADFERATSAATASTLKAYGDRQDTLNATDRAAEARDARRRAAARQTLENRNETLAEDRVDGAWFGALNDLLGVHGDR